MGGSGRLPYDVNPMGTEATCTRNGIRLGAHMSISGGIEKAVERGLKVGCETIQIFTKSSNQWDAAPLTQSQIRRFQSALKASGIYPAFAHTAYLINLASPNPEVFRRSREALRLELERAEALGLQFLILHPGSSKGSSEVQAIRRVAEAVAWSLDRAKSAHVMLLYEIGAGQGDSIGHRFEHLAELMKWTDRPGRVGICLDTCHMFASGYDLRTPSAYEKTMEDFDRLVGFAHLRVVHLNDSKRPLGSRVDRHEHIGRGQIGLAGFRCLLNDPRLKGIPMVLETPKDDECTEDRMNLAVLRSLIHP